MQQRFQFSLVTALILFFISPLAYCPVLPSLEKQAQAWWSKLQPEQQSAIFQWVKHPGEIQRFIHRNRESLKDFLISGKEDTKTHELGLSVKDALEKYKDLNLQNPNMKKESIYWQHEIDVRVFSIVMNLRKSGFALSTEKPIALYRRANEDNKVADGILSSFLATSASVNYAYDHVLNSDELKYKEPLLKIMATDPVVIIPPDLATEVDDVAFFGVRDYFDKTFLKKYPQLPRYYLYSHSFYQKTFENTRDTFYRTFDGELFRDYLNKAYSKKFNTPKFHRSHSEFEVVLLPGNEITSTGTAGRKIRFITYSCKGKMLEITHP